MSYSSEILADSPLLYLKLDETSGTTVLDSSGNGRDGTHVGGVTVNQPPLLADGSGRAALYNGSDGYTDVPYAAWMNVTTATITARIKPSSAALSAPDVTVIAGRWGGDGLANFMFTWISATGKPGVSARIDGVQQLLTGTTQLVADTEYTVAATYDGTALRLFLNGAQEASLTVAGALSASSSPFEVGTVWVTRGVTSYYFTGQVDEVAFYGTGLPAARLLAQHDAAVSSAAPSSDLTLAGTLPAVAAAFDLTTTPPPVDLTLAGALPAVVGTFELSTPIPVDLTLTGVLPAVVGALTLEAPLPVGVVREITLAGILPAVTGDLSLDSSSVTAATQTVNRYYGRDRTCEWDVTVEPPVVAPPARTTRGHDYAVAVSVAPATLVDGRPT